MEVSLDAALNAIDIFILVFVRMTGLFVISPIFGKRNVPSYLKIGFAFLLAIILVNTVTLPPLEYYNNIYMYALLIFKEFIVGITIGYVSYMIFTAIYIAGQMIDMQIGFGMVNVLDPVSNIQIPITSNFYFIISMLVFLTVNGHHILIKGLFDSYQHIPPGSAVFSANLVNDIIKLFENVFMVGFKIAAPITAAILITDVALGVISRSVPQLNVFVVGMPLKIALGILVMIVTIPMFMSIVELLINGMHGEMLNFIKDMVLK